MSYQVLARKWRPRSFATLVGQEHVVRALSNALETGRLHHAWLFTGTRGVGKTTISRILAKALNCEVGVTAEPCGRCDACTSIDADRFPDYVEMDAASNRGVDDMAALLDRAVYAPVQGRYKVYMIDEVHMLTGHAFNAMLKTLEEPPEHVKFILATTDPQKIPVTVLSRCLQFNLKQMPHGHIVAHLGRILEAERVPFEPPALMHLAKSASGSMRDALSLLDQAIAHGAGQVQLEQVVQMLGTVGDDHLFGLLDALSAGEVGEMLSIADAMVARSLSFDAALQSLASLFHRIALMQFAPGAITDDAERARMAPFAQAFDPEFLQLAYQIVIHGRDELPLAPDDYAGFTMTLLRLHAFRPEQPTGAAGSGGSERRGSTGRVIENATPVPVVAAEQGAAASSVSPAVPDAARANASERRAAEHLVERGGSGVAAGGHPPPWEDAGPEPERMVAGGSGATPASARVLGAEAVGAEIDAALQVGDWHRVQRALGAAGLAREFCQHCEWVSLEADLLTIRLGHGHAHLLEMNPGLPARIGELLSGRTGRSVRVKVELGAIAGETPAQRDAAERRQWHVAAVEALERDPFVREVIERFDATLIEASVKPV